MYLEEGRGSEGEKDTRTGIPFFFFCTNGYLDGGLEWNGGREEVFSGGREGEGVVVFD
jgi:hypothetical protein